MKERKLKRRLKKLRIGDVVRVRWNDAMGVSQPWASRKDLTMKLALITSRGVVWKKTKYILAITPHIDRGRDGEGCGAMYIPIRAVRSVKWID